MLELRHKL